MIQKVTEIKDLKGKRVLVRVDFNVPMKKKKILDDARIKAGGFSIQYLRKKGAKVIVVTHLGRPEGKKVSDLSLAPIAKHLEKLLTGLKEKKVKVSLLQDIFGEKEMATLKKMKPGGVVMFENIRFYKEEEKNDEDFARQLASLADVFVMDGFSVAHRDAASVSGVAKFLPSYAGFLLVREINALDTLLGKPKKPFTAVIGGAKIETKLPVIKNILKVANTVLLGGALFNTYLTSRGYGVGASLVDAVEKKYLLALNKKQVIKAVDVVVGKKDGAYARVVPIKNKAHALCEKDEMILDIGPKTIKIFEKYIAKSKTLVWNGAMGYFENEMFAEGTFAIARAVEVQGRKYNFVLVGGGETLEVMQMLKLPPTTYQISTAGGAMLEYLSGKKLPGLKNLA